MTTSETLTLPGFEPTESSELKPSAGASRAKTFRWLAEARVLKESEADSGESAAVSLASFCPSTSSWKTSGLSGLEDLPKFSATLPRSGMTRSGTLYLLPPLVRLIYASGSGSSLNAAMIPTPSAQNCKDPGSAESILSRRQRMSEKHGNNGFGLNLAQAARCGLIPTQTASDANGSGSRNTANSKAHPGVSLMDWARGDGGTGRLLPTPQAQDFRNAADYSDGSRGHSPQLRHLGSGLLNPRFVEWMMRLPSGWTELP